ncbi:MAG: epoxyqueuosine reductase QueH [Bacilli bacterium]|jgi:predicted adenine nucleotide alpha hydrolase (AANH) superfamily ATPase|nr:epoxyqueuosine reductase QueH [Bacilli bacterium]
MPQTYINYYKKSLEIIASLPNDKKPSLLLHACCGPCSCFPLAFLCPHFDVTVFFNNSNIYPQSEYLRRLDELRKFLGFFKRDYGYDVKLIVTPYDNEGYNKDLQPFASLPEGQERCFICYRKRMGEAYDFAEKNGYGFFSTVMTISRQKDSQVLNRIGAELEATHQRTRYFYSDYKKNKGIDVGREMRIHYGLYNQLYCGCKYTYAKGLLKAKEKGLDR